MWNLLTNVETTILYYSRNNIFLTPSLPQQRTCAQTWPTDHKYVFFLLIKMVSKGEQSWCIWIWMLKMFQIYLSRYFPGTLAALSSDVFSHAWYDQNLAQGLISLNPNQGEVTCLMRFPSSHPGSPALGLRSTNAFPSGTQSSKLQICVCHIMSTTF